MAIDGSTIAAIIISLVSIIITIWFAIWSSHGLIKAISGVREDTGTIKQSLDEHMRDLIEIIKHLTVDKLHVGETVEHELKNIGKIEISVEDISVDETIYTILTEKSIFKEGLLLKKGIESEELQNLRKELFQKRKVRIRAVFPTKMKIYLPSTDKETCNRFVTFVLKWLDSVYWNELQQFEEWEESLKEQLDT